MRFFLMGSSGTYVRPEITPFWRRAEPWRPRETFSPDMITCWNSESSCGLNFFVQLLSSRKHNAFLLLHLDKERNRSDPCNPGQTPRTFVFESERGGSSQQRVNEGEPGRVWADCWLSSALFTLHNAVKWSDWSFCKRVYAALPLGSCFFSLLWVRQPWWVLPNAAECVSVCLLLKVVRLRGSLQPEAMCSNRF